MMPPFDRWVVASLLADQPLNGELDTVSDPTKGLAEHLATLPLTDRQTAWAGWLAGQADRDRIIQAVANADPKAPAPAASTVRFATAADIRRLMAVTPWVWEGWIPAARIVGVASPEGTGKSRFALDLTRRVWHGEPWPDNQPMTLPPKTPTLWVCSDGNHDEFVDALPSFGLPDESVIFPAPDHDLYVGTSLDDPDSLKAIEAAIVAHRPAFIFVDTLTYATWRDLCEQRSIAILKSPLIALAQQPQANIILNLHVSRDGQALGRRIKGITRTLIHLECPDPEQSDRLRLWVEKSYAKKPPLLGVTMEDGRNVYDFSPPDRRDPNKGGRPPEKRDKAAQFIRDALAQSNDQIGNDLCGEWVKGGGNERTFWRAVGDLANAGELVKDGGKGTGKQTILHLTQ